MGNAFFRTAAALALAGVGLAQAAPLDLKTAIDRALEVEASYRAARAERRAVEEEVPRARASFLPNLSASGSRTENDSNITRTNVFGQTSRSESTYTSENYALTLRQPLYRRDVWIRYEQAETRVAHAEQQVGIERDKLVLRVAETYLTGVLANAGRQLADAEVQALEGLSASAQRGLEAGVATRTDVLDAHARLDAARVRLIEARHAIEQSRRALETAIGQPVEELLVVDPSRLRLEGLPQRIEQWREAAVAANPEVAAARLTVELALKEVRLQQAGHYPTLDFIAQRQKAASDSINSIGSTYYTNLWGFQLNVPLYSGGHVTASTRQAAFRLERARAEYDATAQKVTLRAAQVFESLNAADQRVQALARAEASARASLEGSEKGVRAGTRTLIDVLNARQHVFEARQEAARAAAEFVLNLLYLKAAVGQLDANAVDDANSRLIAEVGA